MPAGKLAVVKLQDPVLLAVVVPSALAAIRHRHRGAVRRRPRQGRRSLVLTVPLLMTGAAGGGTVTSRGLDAALVPAEVVSVAVKAYVPDDKSAVVKLQLPLLLAVVLPSALEPPSDTVTVAPAGAVPVKLAVVGIDRAAADHRRRAGGTVTSRGLDAALVPAEVVSVAVKAYVPDDKSAVVKLQAPLLLAVVLPSALEPPSDTVTVAPAGAVPVELTKSLALTMPLLITGAAGSGTVTSRGLDAALVPAEVVSVAVKA